MISRSFPLAAVLVLILPLPGLAQQDLLVDIDQLSPQELRSATFTLTATTRLELDAVGAEPWEKEQDRTYQGYADDRTTWPAAAWILDLRTRAVVWDLRTAATERAGGDGLRRFSGSVELPAGTYQAFYGSFVATSTNYSGSIKDLISLGRRARNGRVTYGGHYVDNGAYRRLQFRVRGAGHAATAAEADTAARGFFGSAVATLRPAEDHAVARAGFELSRPTDLDLYAVGEIRRDGPFDYGWIQNADTRAQVWRMDYGNTRPAGGASKNRMARETLHLAPGRYVAYFASDDSHNPDEWNTVPALDPDAWGMTLRVADPAARAAVKTFDWRPVPQSGPVVSITRVGDDELRSQGFSLRHPARVRIYALGEGSDPDGPMSDYAWIIDAATRRRVWIMTRGETAPAGGSDKNRLFDGTLKLPAGDYLLYYRSDDSHAWGDWNASPPAEADYWGVSLFPASTADAGAFAPFRVQRVEPLAELLRMRSDRDWRSTFLLEKPTLVRIHAVGEGTGNEMVDYGWIENGQTGQKVWEMTYGPTVPAGGARKNRMFDGTIRLPPGRYALCFKTDGSHAWGDWNSDPPDDPDAWGIVVYRAQQ